LLLRKFASPPCCKWKLHYGVEARDEATIRSQVTMGAVHCDLPSVPTIVRHLPYP